MASTDACSGLGDWHIEQAGAAWCDHWAHISEEQRMNKDGLARVEGGPGSSVRLLTCVTSSRLSPGALRHSRRPG